MKEEKRLLLRPKAMTTQKVEVVQVIRQETAKADEEAQSGQKW